jgi:FtsZ-binding cell division protein ZapB
VEPISALVASVVAIIVALGASYAFVLRLGSKDGQLRGEVAALRHELATVRGEIASLKEDLLARIGELDDNHEDFKREEASQWQEFVRALGRIEGQLQTEGGSNPGFGQRRK